MSRVFEVLKTALKAKGVTYRDLGAHLGLSESGVKKMLTAKDLSLVRLLEICDWLGISAGELVRLMEKEEIREVELTSSQQEAFLKDQALFRVYWRLAVEKESPESIRRAEGLTAAEWQRKILRLQRLDLVVEEPSGRIRPRHQGLFRWAEGNPLIEKLKRDWSRNVLEASLSKDGGLHRLVSLRLSEEARVELSRALESTVDDFIRRSLGEEATRRAGDLRPYRLLLAGAPGRFIDPE